jgi:hypothetical protein
VSESDPRNESAPTRCELCGREKPLHRHHLIPKSMHKKTRFQKQFGKEEMLTRSLMICKLCHNGIHDLIGDNKQLADAYNTKESLLAHEAMQKHIAWVKKQK